MDKAFFALLLLVLQNTSKTLLLRFAVGGRKPQFLYSAAVLGTEGLKCTLSVLWVLRSGGSTRSIVHFVRSEWRMFLRVMVPAAVYNCQQVLEFVALSKLEAHVFSVLVQTKLLTTALFCVLIMGKQLRRVQRGLYSRLHKLRMPNNPLDDLIQAVLQTPAHGGRAIGQPFGQQVPQILDLRRAVQANDVDIGPYVLFQPGGGEQMRHHGLGIHAVAARHDYETCGVFMIGLIAQIRDHRQFLGCHLRGDLFQHLGTGGLIRQRIDHHFAGFDPIGRTHLDLAVARGIQPA